ncbi:hypothetical protein GCM10010411_08600 [Actinomadura fulvescens]|uniref:Uncharacterized protein n=1 Tax=Actinomadura fulvescens TaxID=46160 RepID=A0ABN3PGN2_9ACTN
MAQEPQHRDSQTCSQRDHAHKRGPAPLAPPKARPSLRSDDPIEAPAPSPKLGASPQTPTPSVVHPFKGNAL